MKRNISTISIVALLLLAAACDKKLDIEPAQSISEGLALSTDANVKTVLLGAYDALSEGALLGGSGVTYSELQGADGEIRWVGTYTGLRQIFNHQMAAENDDADALWKRGYTAINICNNVLEVLPVVKEADRDQVKGEALFIRAFSYFQLVRFYAKPFEIGGANTQLGIPIVLRPTRGIDASSFVARNTVKQVYDQIETDLHEAMDLLPEDNGTRASKYAAMALLARFHLQNGVYTEARELADAVIASNVFALTPTIADEFNNDENTSEDIFAVQVSDQDGDNDLVIYYSIPDFGGRDGDIEIEQKHLDLYTNGDERKDFHYEGNGALRTTKWRDQYKNIPVLRLAEMYLISAECAVRAGASGDAAYNATHTRAGLAPAGNVTLDDVLLERRLELAHEGHRMHDVKRLKGSVDGLGYNDPSLVFPIPAREISANKNLEQNEGY